MTAFDIVKECFGFAKVGAVHLTDQNHAERQVIARAAQLLKPWAEAIPVRAVRPTVDQDTSRHFARWSEMQKKGATTIYANGFQNKCHR